MDGSVVIPVGTVLSLAVGINTWFLKRLIIKVEELSERNPVQENQISTLSKEIESLQGQIQQLSHDIKDFGHLRERVAVIEALMLKRKEKLAHHIK